MCLWTKGRTLEIRSADLISSVLPFVHKHIEMSGSDPNKVFYIPIRCEIEENTPAPPLNTNNKDVLNVTYIGGYGDSHDPITIVKALTIVIGSWESP